MFRLFNGDLLIWFENLALICVIEAPLFVTSEGWYHALREVSQDFYSSFEAFWILISLQKFYRFLLTHLFGTLDMLLKFDYWVRLH